MPRWVLTAGLLFLTIAASAYAGLLLVRGPHPIFVHIRWAPGIDEAERVPGSFLAQALWAVTALCLFMGLTAVSAALIARPPPRSRCWRCS